MEKITGGFKHIIFADNALFGNFSEIVDILKQGTSIVPGTDTEEGSDNETLSVIKKIAMSIRSADHDSTIYDVLKDAEEARTPMFFRFLMLNPNYYIDLFSLSITAKKEMNEAGKFNAVNITGAGEAESESALLNLVYLFNPFNPENV